jgi:hypothetical protein
MPAVMRFAASCLLATAAAYASAGGCRPKVSATQCDQLLDRYAQLVVSENFSDASAEQIRSERDREKSEARTDDAFKNCSSEVSRAEFDCAMRALNANAFEKCVE